MPLVIPGALLLRSGAVLNAEAARWGCPRVVFGAPSFYLLLDVFLLICLCAASSQENGTSDCSVPKRRGKMISEASEIFGQIISELPFN